MKNEAISSTVESFSELSVAVDPFSRLPDQLIHRILRRVRSNKEAARTSVLSKQWLRAWRSFPVQEYDIAEFMVGVDPKNERQVEARCRKFVKFVDQTLERSTAVHRSLILTAVDRMGPQISRWVETALDNEAEKVTIHGRVKGDRSDWVACNLPIRLLSADFLTVLVLMGPMMVLPVDEIPKVNLPNLEYLGLSNSHICDDQLSEILRGSPKLVSISLVECESLYGINIWNLNNLRTVSVSITTHTADLYQVRVNAPSLETFKFSSTSTMRMNTFIKISHCTNLKSLSITDKHKSEKWFNDFFAKFPLLEKLTIDDCPSLTRIQLSNPRLEWITIQECQNLTYLVVESKRVKSLKVHGCLAYSMFLGMMIKMDAPQATSCAYIKCGYYCLDKFLNTDVFIKLQHFLTRTVQFNEFGFYLAARQSQHESGTLQPQKVFPGRAYGMESLVIGVTAPERSFPFIMTGLLSTIHPKLVRLVVTNEFKAQFVKFFCEELAKKVTHSRRCCRGNSKCWKYLLKGVKVDEVLGVKSSKGLDLHSLIDLVPTIEHHFVVYLYLEWSTLGK